MAPLEFVFRPTQRSLVACAVFTAVWVCIASLVSPAVRADEPTKKEIKERCALFDEIWKELSTHDAFFDPAAADTKKLHDEYRERIAKIDDENERLREVVRVISRLGDGHTHISTRWFLPDKPPPPLPLAGKEPLYRPSLSWQKFHRDYYIRYAIPDETGADGKPLSQFCRIAEIDGALISHGSGWELLNGAKDTDVTVKLERPDGRTLDAAFQRTKEVNPPKHFAPTTQIVEKKPDGTEKKKEVEVVVKSRRLEGNIGFIHIEHLVTTQVVTDFNAALDALMDTDGMILDLRDTHGGYPWIALPIAGRFFDSTHKVCSFDGRSPLIAATLRGVSATMGPVGTTYTKPLIVLANDGTGSMSEGLTFSLSDTGRALFIGRPTMGLNAAIRNTTLKNGMVLWHSWVRVNRLDGAHYQGVGVQPQELVEVPVAEAMEIGIDKAIAKERQLQLDRALQRVRERIAAAAPGPAPASQPSAAP